MSADNLTTYHEIPVRDPALSFDAPIPIFWFRDNAYLTFLFNGFNLTFPQGERHFVRAVHDHLPLVRDPNLRVQIRGFSGQEGQHARVHELLFDALRAQGFELSGFFHAYDAYIKRIAKSPAAWRLAATAALEHYTATLAELVFKPEFLEGVHEPLRKLLVWHAAEELEHRAVAFDVLRVTRPSYALRVFGFFMATISLVTWMARGMRLFVRQSGVSKARMRRDARRAAELVPPLALLRAVLLYLRPGFHPSQVGSLDAALERLRREGLDAPQLRRPGAGSDEELASTQPG